jgi:hypothetical protein
MKRLLVLCWVALAPLCAHAQVPIPQPYASLMAGTTLNTQSLHVQPRLWYYWDTSLNTGFLGSVEGGFPMTRWVGVHLDYLATTQSFTESYTSSGEVRSKGTAQAPVNIVEAGAEFLWCPTQNQEFFGQINLGRTLGSESLTTAYSTQNYSSDRTDHFRDNAWTVGLAAGYRWYFSKFVGLGVQVTYHHISGWDFSTIWAAQAGISFRF